MKKIRTTEELDDELSNAIVWRKQELAIAKSMIQTSKTSSGKSDYLIRSGVALLYAHWEGFVKEAGMAYLMFVSMKRLTYQDLAPNFIALAIKAKLDEASHTNKAIIHNELVEFFLSGLSERSRIPRDSDALNTESNLRSHVLKNIIFTLGLDYSTFETKEKLIDEKLVNNRNEIAHGKELVVDKEEILELYEEILGLMELFRSQIINAAILKNYRAAKNLST